MQEICRACPIVVLLLGSLVWTAASAAMIKMSLEDLTLKASIIVGGKVTGKTSEKTAEGIKTRVTLAVQDALKGDVGQELVITQPGGVVGKLEMVVPESATFEVGEEALVFLWTRSNGEHSVLGLSQGKLPVEIDKDGRKFVQVPPAKGESFREQMRLEDFVERIDEILKRAEKANTVPETVPPTE